MGNESNYQYAYRVYKGDPVQIGTFESYDGINSIVLVGFGFTGVISVIIIVFGWFWKS